MPSSAVVVSTVSRRAGWTRSRKPHAASTRCPVPPAGISPTDPALLAWRRSPGVRGRRRGRPRRTAAAPVRWWALTRDLMVACPYLRSTITVTMTSASLPSRSLCRAFAGAVETRRLTFFPTGWELAGSHPIRGFISSSRPCPPYSRPGPPVLRRRHPPLARAAAFRLREHTLPGVLGQPRKVVQVPALGALERLLPSVAVGGDGLPLLDLACPAAVSDFLHAVHLLWPTSRAVTYRRIAAWASHGPLASRVT